MVSSSKPILDLILWLPLVMMTRLGALMVALQPLGLLSFLDLSPGALKSNSLFLTLTLKLSIVQLLIPLQKFNGYIKSCSNWVFRYKFLFSSFVRTSLPHILLAILFSTVAISISRYILTLFVKWLASIIYR